MFDEPVMQVIVVLLVFLGVLGVLSEVYDWAESRKHKVGRRGGGDAAAKRRSPDQRSAKDRTERHPDTTRSLPPDRRGDRVWHNPPGGSGSPPFGGATGEAGSIFKKDRGGMGASPGNDARSPWERAPRSPAGQVAGRSPDGLDMELARFGSAAGATGDEAALPPRSAGPDHARLVLEAWRDAWASDVVSVRALVDRMGRVPGVRGVSVLPESSVVVVRFDGDFLAVPSQQDYELCEKLFEADRPPGRFATVIDLERAAVVSGMNGELVQRGMLKIECG